MRIFITGATGYIGAAVAARLVDDGHHVTGLARTRGSADKLTAAGIDPVAGDLTDLDVLAGAAAGADAIISLAQPGFDPGGDFFAQMAETGAVMEAAIGAIVDAVAGTGKLVIFTGGTGAYGDTGDRVVDEDTPIDTPAFMQGLANAEHTVLSESGIRGIATRPGIVYGYGGGPFAMFAAMARSAGSVNTFGDGSNTLSTVHLDDLVDGYVLLIERGEAGARYNFVNEPWPTQLEVMQAIASGMGAGPVTPLPDAIAQQLLAGGAGIFARTSKVSAARARQLGWNPSRPSAPEQLAAEVSGA